MGTKQKWQHVVDGGSVWRLDDWTVESSADASGNARPPWSVMFKGCPLWCAPKPAARSTGSTQPRAVEYQQAHVARRWVERNRAVLEPLLARATARTTPIPYDVWETLASGRDEAKDEARRQDRLARFRAEEELLTRNAQARAAAQALLERLRAAPPCTADSGSLVAVIEGSREALVDFLSRARLM